MKVKRLIIGFGGLSVIVAICAPHFFEYGARQELLSLSRQGIKISAEDLSGTTRGITALKAQTWLPISSGETGRAFPLSLELSDISVWLTASASLTRMPTIRFSASAYGGKISGEIFNVLAEPQLSLTLFQIDLSQHPQLNAAGLRQGLLNGSIDSVGLNPSRPANSSFRASLTDVALSAPPIIESLLALKEVTDATLSIEGSLDDSGEFSLSPIQVNSSLLRAKGEGRGALGVPQGSPRLAAHLRVQLIGKAGEPLAQWLPIISNNAIDASQRSFSVSLSSSSCTSAGMKLTIGSLCLTPIFAPLTKTFKVPE